jgi:hypothetical protein
MSYENKKMKKFDLSIQKFIDIGLVSSRGMGEVERITTLAVAIPHTSFSEETFEKLRKLVQTGNPNHTRHSKAFKDIH